MVQSFELSFNDYDREVGKQNFNVETVTAANFDAQATLRTAYINAAAALAGGIVRNFSSPITGTLSRQLPSSQEAQREKKWKVTVTDDIDGEIYTTTVPTADLQFLQNNSSYLIQNGNIVGNDTGGEITAYKSAFEAYYRTKNNNTATILNMEFVGANT